MRLTWNPLKTQTDPILRFLGAEGREEAIERSINRLGLVDIYAIGPKRGPLKIGKSGNVHGRLEALQTSNYERLEIIAYLPGPDQLETAIQAFLGKSRIRGEWFNRTEDVLRVIDFMRYKDLSGLLDHMDAALEPQKRTVLKLKRKTGQGLFLK